MMFTKLQIISLLEGNKAINAIVSSFLSRKFHACSASKIRILSIKYRKWQYISILTLVLEA